MICALGPLLTPLIGWFMKLVGKEIEKQADKPQKKKPKPKRLSWGEIVAKAKERAKHLKKDVGPPAELDDNPYDEG